MTSKANNNDAVKVNISEEVLKKSASDNQDKEDSKDSLIDEKQNQVSDSESDTDVKESEKKKDEDSESKDPSELLKIKEKELTNSKDRFLRLSAEFDNYKKRSRREMDDFKKFAYETIIRELLPVLDSMESALSISKDEVCKSIFDGVELTHKEMLRILSKYGVTQIESINKKFDPSYHQAMAQEESNDVPENTVTKEVQKGYLLHHRLLRPAMVMVSKKPPQEIESKEEITETDSNEKNND